MKQQKMVFTFSEDGSFTSEAIGYEGHGCREATRPIEEALGAVTSTEDKPELLQRRTETNLRTW